MGKHGEKRTKKWLIIIVIILVILVLLGILVGKIINSKLSKLNIKAINEGNLSINEELLREVEGLTQKEFADVKKVVLFGIDTQSSGDGQDEEGFLGRSDTIMIVAINPKYKSLKMISIPRDTYVEIEGHGKMKINHAYAIGQEELAIKTINSNFGLDITEYATIDFSGLAHIINDIGGIKLNITRSERDFINVHSKEVYSITGGTVKKISSYGTVALDGEQAVAHSRNRSIGDDFTRASRQRDVLEAIINKMFEMELSEISNLIDVFLSEVITNINVVEYTGTITEILLNKDIYLNNVISAQVPSKDYATGQYIKGIYYFVPSDTERMKQDMIDYLYRK